MTATAMKTHCVDRWSAGLALLAVTATPLAAQEGGRELPLPDFEIDGEIRHEGQRWQADGFSGRVGDVPVEGSLAVDLGGQRPHVDGAVRLPSFDYQAARQLVEDMGLLDPDADDAGGLLPSFDLPTAWLDRASVALDIELDDIRGLSEQVNAVSTHLSLEDARLALKPLDVAFSQGTIAGEMALNARQETASADAILDFAEIDLEPLLDGTRLGDMLSGLVEGELRLLGTGDSMDELFATADGEVSIRMAEGSVSGLLLEAAGIDVVETLALALGEGDRVPIACGRIDLVVADGVATITRLLVDTTDSIVVGGGTIDLADETLDLGIETRAKDFSLIDLSAPVLIGGTLSEPAFAVGDIDGLPFFQEGEGEAVDCPQLLSADIRQTQAE